MTNAGSHTSPEIALPAVRVSSMLHPTEAFIQPLHRSVSLCGSNIIEGCSSNPCGLSKMAEKEHGEEDNNGDQAQILRSYIKSFAECDDWWPETHMSYSWNKVKNLPAPSQFPRHTSLSNHVIIACESLESLMVLAVDWRTGSVYEVTSKFFPERIPFANRNGYALAGDMLYVVGGEYPPSSCGFPQNQFKIQAYNLSALKWEEEGLPILNGPKPSPMVFAFDDKLYALPGGEGYWCDVRGLKFEYIDTRKIGSGDCSSSPCYWNVIQDIPEFIQERFYEKHRTRMMINKETQVLIVTFGREDLNEERALHIFDFKSSKWLDNTHPRAIEVYDSLTHVPNEHLIGCIVKNKLVCYENDLDGTGPIIVVHYLGKTKVNEPFKINLIPYLQGKVECLEMAIGNLIHVGGHTFCLIISHFYGEALCNFGISTFTFDLVEFFTIGESKKRKSDIDVHRLELNRISCSAVKLPGCFFPVYMNINNTSQLIRQSGHSSGTA